MSSIKLFVVLISIPFVCGAKVQFEQKQAEDYEAAYIAPQNRWSVLQDTMRNTVVQVFVYGTSEDLLRPYRSPQTFMSRGSAFFINDQGELITNAHVVEQARGVWIQIPALGKQQLDVDIVGVCPERDLALLRLTGDSYAKIMEKLDGIPFLHLGDSDSVDRADEIMTLGFPLGQEGLKITTGIVSGREDYGIQISAPINPGNSGGPSVNVYGQVIGINSSGIMSAQNVGYIIPSNELKVVLDDLRTTPLLLRPSLGIAPQIATDELLEYLGNPLPGGVYVKEVIQDGLAEKIGVQSGDVLYEINGHRIDAYGEISWGMEKISVRECVGLLQLGQEVTMVLYRNGQRKEINFLFEQTEPLAIRELHAGFEKLSYEIVAGVVVQPLNLNHVLALKDAVPSLARYVEYENQQEPCLIITDVIPDSVAQRSRSLALGSILSEVNGYEVCTLKDVREALLESALTKRITLKTDDNTFVVFGLDKVLHEEERLSQIYAYRSTCAMEELHKRCMK